jgi:hypothetical protein
MRKGKMNCPKCNRQNPGDAKSCQTCGCELTASHETQPKIKTSKEAIVALVLAILSPFTLMVTSFPSIFLGLISLLKIQKSNGKLKGKPIAKAGIIISTFFLLVLLLWRTDAPPISNDYTIKDIKSAASEYNQTYELLQSITGDYDKSTEVYGMGIFGEMGYINNIFSKNDLQTISQEIGKKAQVITNMWDNAEHDREILKKIDSFPEIADLTEPKLEIQPLKLSKLILLYRAYINLQIIEGHYEEALKELSLLDSIINKMSINARQIVTKIFCDASFDIEAFLLNLIINNPDTPNEILLSTRNQIDSFSSKQSSFRNSLIFEYLCAQKELAKMADTNKLKYHPVSTLKYNSTLRFIRNHFDELIAKDQNIKNNNKLKIWPSIYPNIPVQFDDSGELDSILYRIYNPVGFTLIEQMVPAIDKAVATKITLLIHSDMLKIVLNARLGEKYDLKARAYGNEYIIDIENKKIFSPGPDGKNGTEDDISLPINPEVLGLKTPQNNN